MTTFTNVTTYWKFFENHKSTNYTSQHKFSILPISQTHGHIIFHYFDSTHMTFQKEPLDIKESLKS